MSGLGKVPNFEPDEEFKNMLEELFAPKKEAAKEEVKKISVEDAETYPPKKKEKKWPTKKIKIPEPPAHTKEEEKEALKFAQQELNTLFDAFYNFTEAAGETIVFGYLYNDIQELVARFEDIDVILGDKVDTEKLTEYGLTDFEKYRKIRARVLHDIYNKYKKSK